MSDRDNDDAVARRAQEEIEAIAKRLGLWCACPYHGGGFRRITPENFSEMFGKYLSLYLELGLTFEEARKKAEDEFFDKVASYQERWEEASLCALFDEVLDTSDEYASDYDRLGEFVRENIEAHVAASNSPDPSAERIRSRIDVRTVEGGNGFVLALCFDVGTHVRWCAYGPPCDSKAKALELVPMLQAVLASCAAEVNGMDFRASIPVTTDPDHEEYRGLAVANEPERPRRRTGQSH